jgi:crotonobetainyl-CoA:carnitine CoA-transferase CaiB-like acyl-CoA transferase
LPEKGRSHIDRIGEHTTEILEEFGYSREEIAALFAAKVVA